MLECLAWRTRYASAATAAVKYSHCGGEATAAFMNKYNPKISTGGAFGGGICLEYSYLGAL